MNLKTNLPADQAKQNQFRSDDQNLQAAQFQIEDSRSELVHQLQQQTRITNSARARQLRVMQSMATSSPKVLQLQDIQRMIGTNSAAKTSVQRVKEDKPLQRNAHDSLNQRKQTETRTPQPKNTGPNDNFDSNETLQLYKTDGGKRISENNRLLWENPTTIYASEDKIIEANAMNGQVEFSKGDSYNGSHLHEVKVEPREALAGQTEQFGLNVNLDRERNRLERGFYPNMVEVEERVQGIVENSDVIRKLIAGKNMDMEVTIGKLRSASEKVSARVFDISQGKKFDNSLVINAVAHEIFESCGNFLESDALRYFTIYKNAQEASSDRVLMPSDCRLMAQVVSGKDLSPDEKNNWSESPAVKPGNVYGKKENATKPGEWDFHFAAIIMADGEDHITMENAGAKASEGFQKAQYDKTWFFNMFGPNKGQTFGDLYDRDLGYETEKDEQ